MVSVLTEKKNLCASVLACLTITLALSGATTNVDSLERRKLADSMSLLNTPLGPRMLVVGTRTPINPPDSGYHGEVMAAADPESDQHIIVCGFRANQRSGSAYEGYVYWSGDRGKTWNEVLVDRNSQWVSEESCAFGPGHQAYFVVGDSDTSRGVPNHESGNTRIYRSSDSGRTWKATQVWPFMDYTSTTVDGSSSPHRNTVYIVANAIASSGGGWVSDDQAPFLSARKDSNEISFSTTNGSFRSGSKFPKGSAVLSDGTVLALFEGKTKTNHATGDGKTELYSVELGVSNDGGKTFTKRVVYEDPTRSVVTALVVNRITGEIYLCWTPQEQESVESRIMEGAKSRLVLAISHDNGRTWTIKAVKPSTGALDLSAGTVSLAINDDGVLGFMWYGTNVGNIYFGISFDEGDSIAKVVPLSVASNTIRSKDVVPLADDRRLFVFPPAWKASSQRVDPLRILPFGPNPRGTPFGNALVADKKGEFHPVWSEVTNGPTHLWTRTISLREAGSTGPAVVRSGLTDVSDRVVWHISNVRYDHLEDLVTFDVIVTNTSEETIAGPVVTVVADSKERLELFADNADNGATGAGASWVLQVPSEGLRCEYSTEPRTLTFHMKPRNVGARLDYEPRDLPLRLYGYLP